MLGKTLQTVLRLKLKEIGISFEICSNSFKRTHNVVRSRLMSTKTEDAQKEHSENTAFVEQRQVEVPDLSFNGGTESFRGLQTDFPCLAYNMRTANEPYFANINTGYKMYTHKEPFPLSENNALLPELNIAYETWGELNEDKDNAILIQTGLSASSHAKSHANNMEPGWWEKFIGPGCAIDTNRFFVVCSNNLGGCYGTTGPSSINPCTGKPYATTFPVLTVEDMVRAQFLLLDHLGIDKLYAAVGSSLGGIQSIKSGVLFPERMKKLVSISSCARTPPSSIAIRYLQRKAIMLDPNWQRGYYYDSGRYPRVGMKLAREIATMSYRSGPEWQERFGRIRIQEDEDPSLCPYFMVENYLDYQGENWCMKYDPNSLIYISKAMDFFDLSESCGSMTEALKRVKCPVLIMGVKTDILFPVQLQRELAEGLEESGNHEVTYYEITSPYGHDTFLLDLSNIGAGVKGFLETDMIEKGRARKRKTHSSKQG